MKPIINFIVEELKHPFFKRTNSTVNELSGFNLFYKLAGESQESFYAGLVTQVRIISLITNERYAGLRATTDSGIEGKIGIDDIRDNYKTQPEELKSIARVNMSLSVRVKEIKVEDNGKKINVTFSSKNSDLTNHIF